MNCRIGCTCRRHKHPGPWSLMTRAARDNARKVMREEKKKHWANGVYDLRPKKEANQPEAYARASASIKAGIASGVIKDRGYRNFSGGKLGDTYAALLCPVGYVREFAVWFKDKFGYKTGYKLDFALVSRKVNIEIDGPKHVGTTQSDVERDTKMKSLGWLVIRVKVTV